MSLRGWFYRNARLPLFLSFVTFLSVELLLLLLIGRSQWQHQLEVSQRFAELTKLALLQRSSSVLQTGIDIAARDLRALKAFVCDKKSECNVETRWGFRVLEIPIELKESEAKKFHLVLQVPVLPRGTLIYFTLLSSFLACFVVFFLLSHVRKRLEKDLFTPLFKNLSHDSALPIRELENLRIKMQELNHLRTQEAVSQAVLARSRQVAHDIKSPLTALLFASRDFDLLPNKSRSVIQSAVRRIESIADSLLSGEGKKPAGEAFYLQNCIQEIFEEKKLEYCSLTLLKWKLAINESDPLILSCLPVKEIQRLLSNLINNAVEATRGLEGLIEVGGENRLGDFEIWVRDEGVGFEPDFLPLVGTEGATYGKPQGRGLGLSYAKLVLAKVGGHLTITRNSAKGTVVRVFVPRTNQSHRNLSSK